MSAKAPTAPRAATGPPRPPGPSASSSSAAARADAWSSNRPNTADPLPVIMAPSAPICSSCRFKAETSSSGQTCSKAFCIRAATSARSPWRTAWQISSRLLSSGAPFRSNWANAQAVGMPVCGLTSTQLKFSCPPRGISSSPAPVARWMPPVRQKGTSAPTCAAISSWRFQSSGSPSRRLRPKITAASALPPPCPPGWGCACAAAGRPPAAGSLQHQARA